MPLTRRQFLAGLASLAGYETLAAVGLTPGSAPRVPRSSAAPTQPAAGAIQYYQLPFQVPQTWRRWATQPNLDEKTGLATFRWDENWAPIYPPDLPRVSNLAALTPQDLAGAAKYFGPDRGARYIEVIKGQTKCNVFVLDWLQALAREIPRYEYRTTYGEVFKMNTSMMHTWLKHEGQAYGWQAVDVVQAQVAANSGQPALAIISEGNFGHVAAVMPTNTGAFSGDESLGQYYPPVASAAAGDNQGFVSADLAFRKWVRVRHLELAYFVNFNSQPYHFIYGDEQYSWPPTDLSPITGLDGLTPNIPVLDQRDCPGDSDTTNDWNSSVYTLKLARGRTCVLFGLHVDLTSDEVYGKGAGANGESVLQINSKLAAQCFGKVELRPGDSLSFTEKIGFWSSATRPPYLADGGKGACYTATVFTELFGLRIRTAAGKLIPFFQIRPGAVQAHAHQIPRYHGWGTAVNASEAGKLRFRINPELPPNITLAIDMRTYESDPANPWRGIYAPIARAVISKIPIDAGELEIQRLTANRDGILKMITANY